MKQIFLFFILFSFSAFAFVSCKQSNTNQKSEVTHKDSVKYTIEFIELGSVNCIPCKKMQPVMASIEKRYEGKVKVTFYDVWKDDAPAKKYNVELIPTQVFLDANGKEIYRHEGFFPEEEIDKFLESTGVRASGL